MREPPDLPEATILDCLRTEYGLGRAALTFLPLGEDSSAWAYRVEPAGGEPLFLKLRRGPLNLPGLLAPFFLRGLGVGAAVAPLPNRAGAIWTPLAEYAAILYPFVTGRRGADGGLSDEQWVALGQLARRMHEAAIPDDLLALLCRERFTPDYLDLLRAVARRVTDDDLPDDLARELGAAWRGHAAAIETLVARATVLGGRLRAAELPHVLCHADLHTWNVLAGYDGRLWVVDWDEVTFAPRERDLMFVVGGISAALVSPRAEALFFTGYGPAAVDGLALTYYRCAWAVQDIGEFAARVVLHPELGQPTRRAALEAWGTLFQPGEIVSIALGSAGG